MGEDEINIHDFLTKFFEQTVGKLRTYRTKYPILYDYCISKEKDMSELYTAYATLGSVESRKQKAADLYGICHEVSLSLQVMDTGNFPFLYDEILWPMLRTALLENKLPINHRWAKSLIAANILELVINDTINKLDPSKYEKLNKDRSGLDTRFKELNSILISKKLDKFKLNTVKFDSLRAIRNVVDHPDPNILQEIEDKHVNETIEYAITALNQLRQAQNELDGQSNRTTLKESEKPLAIFGIKRSEEYGRAKFTDFKIPEKMERGKSFLVSATIKGTIKQGFLDLSLISPDGIVQWIVDEKSWNNEQLDKMLNFANNGYSNTWPFKIPDTAKLGKWVAVMALYENDPPNRRYVHAVEIEFNLEN